MKKDFIILSLVLVIISVAPAFVEWSATFIENLY